MTRVAVLDSDRCKVKKCDKTCISYCPMVRSRVEAIKIEGKKAVLVAPAGDGPSECYLVTEMFRRSFEYLKIEFLGYALGKAYDKKEILNDEQAMKKAAELGSML